MYRHVFVLAGLAGMFIPLHADASCGSASCSLITQVDTLGFPGDAGWGVGLRYEYIDQSTPRNGTSEVAVGQIHQHHDEVYTINRNLIATIDYRNHDDWGVSVMLPYVQRDHYHIHTHLGVAYDERWDIAALGDVRVVAYSGGVQIGLKLPTGDTHQTNDDGEFAERSLQPGTGTTDLVLGYATRGMTSVWSSSAHWFVQAQLQTPLSAHDDFRTGTQYHIDSGMVFRSHTKLSPILQLNAVVKDRDEGAEAEPGNSGGEYLWLSPGISGLLGTSVRAYGFVQLPLYQRVNGVQLTADWTASVGISWQL